MFLYCRALVEGGLNPITGNSISTQCYFPISIPQNMEMGSGKMPVQIHHAMCASCGSEIVIEDYGNLDGIHKRLKKKDMPKKVKK
jgi:hypothetical protein